MPTLSTTVGGVQVACRRRVPGEVTSQGTPKPWGMDDPDWYWVQGRVLPTVTVTLAAVVPPGPVQDRVYVLDCMGVRRSVPPWGLFDGV